MTAGEETGYVERVNVITHNELILIRAHGEVNRASSDPFVKVDLTLGRPVSRVR